MEYDSYWGRLLEGVTEDEPLNIAVNGEPAGTTTKAAIRAHFEDPVVQDMHRRAEALKHLFRS
jgi:hypothetical protein